MKPGPEVIKLLSSSTQLRLKFILLINDKMPKHARKIHTSARIYERKFDTGEWKSTPARPTGRVAFLGMTGGSKCP